MALEQDKGAIMPKPRVTIITPAYNCGKYIRNTIESVEAQNYDGPVRHIVLNDGSTDNTNSIIREYPSVEVVRHENMGEAKTVNRGLAMVDSEYFMVLNADDVLYGRSVKELVQFMEAHPDVLVAYPDWDSIGENGEFHSHIKVKDYDYRYMVRYHACLPSVGSMFRSSVIKDVGYRNTSYRWVGDFEYLLRIGLKGPMAHVPDALACWRNREGQATRDKGTLQAQEHIRLIQKFYGQPELPQSVLSVRNEAECWAYLVAAVVTQDRMESVRLLARAISQYPRILIDRSTYQGLMDRLLYIVRR